MGIKLILCDICGEYFKIGEFVVTYDMEYLCHKCNIMREIKEAERERKEKRTLIDKRLRETNEITKKIRKLENKLREMNETNN